MKDWGIYMDQIVRSNSGETQIKPKEKPKKKGCVSIFVLTVSCGYVAQEQRRSGIGGRENVTFLLRGDKYGQRVVS